MARFCANLFIYEGAWAEWAEIDDSDLWDAVTADDLA